MKIVWLTLMARNDVATKWLLRRCWVNHVHCKIHPWKRTKIRNGVCQFASGVRTLYPVEELDPFAQYSVRVSHL
jgi:hypothetical protein